MDVFAERYKALKKAKALTYPQIAERLGVGVRATQLYAQGKGKPDYEGLLELADYFGVSLDYLVGRSDNPERR
jgi:transcriptional regulator with XRE-family HTH domain